jgi:hypothetical protein
VTREARAVLVAIVRVLDRDERPATLPVLRRETSLCLTGVLSALHALRKDGLVRYTDDDRVFYPTREGRRLVPLAIRSLSDFLPEPAPAVPAGGGGFSRWAAGEA